MLLGLSLGITWHQFDLPTSCFPTATWTNKSSTNCFHSLQQTPLWHFSISPSHLPTTLLHLARANLHEFCFPEQSWRQGHRVVSHLNPLHVCACVCVCSTEIWVFSHTPFKRKEWMLMILFQFQRKDLCVPQLFAAAGNLHSFILNSLTVLTRPLFSMMLPSAFVTTVPSQTTTEFLPRVAIFLVFWCIDISFTYLPQIFCQTSENTLGKFEERTWTPIDTVWACDQALQGLRHV